MPGVLFSIETLRCRRSLTDCVVAVGRLSVPSSRTVCVFQRDSDYSTQRRVKLAIENWNVALGVSDPAVTCYCSGWLFHGIHIL